MIQLSVLAVGLAGVDDCRKGGELQELKPTIRTADIAAIRWVPLRVATKSVTARLEDAPSTPTCTS
jgi:hypothetical protein